ncbi:MATE family efflux transporter [Neptunitalea lumnitzerae]|uniref:Na+-driven multidrug efflux pump n=1 Tax=Neptunitalea lumnitzerae TaxID=2965509 RepID=A0ABQ5MGW1_9FLAO|nr:MATE family efflux transporter [Neptunitalea sp. Y10]GLB48653.1 hypothetical protein Y10_10210 [Neptunitalea sp. Y10]
MSTANRIIKNTGFLYARMAITIFISLYSTRLILEALGADEFGIFNVVGGSITMLLFLNNAMTAASQRFMSYVLGEDKLEKLKSVFVSSLLIHLIVGLLIVVILEVGGMFLFDGVLKIPPESISAAKFIYQVLIISTFFNIISVPYDAVINAHENMFLVAILGISQAFFRLFIALFLMYSHGGLKVYGVLMASMAIILMLIKRIYCHINYDAISYKIKNYFSKDLFYEMIGYAGWNILQSSSRVLSIQGMSIVLNSNFGVLVNAAQGIANQVNGQLNSFSTTMLQALNPVIVKSEGAKKRDTMLKTSIAGSKLSFFLFAVLAIPFIVEADYILGVWLKKVPEFAVIFCRLILLVTAIRQITITLNTAIASTGRIKNSSIVEAIVMVMLLPVSILLFWAGGKEYVIYLVLIGVEVCIGASRIWFAHKYCGLGIGFFVRNVVLVQSLIFITTITLTYFVSGLFVEGFIRLIISGAVSSVMMIFLTLFLAFSAEERGSIKKVINSLVNKVKGGKK